MTDQEYRSLSDVLAQTLSIQQKMATVVERTLSIKGDVMEIKEHLKKQNDKLIETKLCSERNKNNIAWIIKIGGAAFTVETLAFILKIFGVY